MDIESLKTKNFYEVLGIPPDASEEQIKEVYKDLARLYHPDSNFYAEITGGKASADQVQIFKVITAAYNTLTDREKRAEYDRTIAPLLSLATKVRRWEDDAREEMRSSSKIKNEARTSDARRRMSGVFGKPTFDEETETAQEVSLTEVPPEEITRTKLSLSAFIMIFGLVAGIVAGGISYFVFMTQH